ncbi:MAG: PilZ domain-containing protein [Candidatus Sedimenticola sp. (ex Thyasira tokunagai)]
MYFGKQPTNSYSTDRVDDEERAFAKRHNLIYYLKVWDLSNDILLGHLIDINTDGLMLVSNQPIKIDQEFEIEIRWEDPDEQFKNIRVNACSRWTGSDKTPSLHNTGFQLIRPSEEVIAGIQEVIREYTFS